MSRIKERYLRNREKDANAPWRQWLRERYARYWYGIGCLFLDIVIAGTILQGGPSPTQAWQYALAAVLVVGVTVLEVKGYMWIWPPEKPQD